MFIFGGLWPDRIYPIVQNTLIWLHEAFLYFKKKKLEILEVIPWLTSIDLIPVSSHFLYF